MEGREGREKGKGGVEGMWSGWMYFIMLHSREWSDFKELVLACNGSSCLVMEEGVCVGGKVR